MGKIFGNLIAGTVDRIVGRVVLPIVGVIPFLVSSGILLAVFAALWLGFGAALATNPSALDDASRSIGQLPLPVLGLVWLLFMPLMAGLWVWGTDWPLVVRLGLMAGIAGWNLMVFIPRREHAGERSVGSTSAIKS